MYIDFKSMSVSELESCLKDLQGLVYRYFQIGSPAAARRVAPIMKCQDIGHAILRKKRVAAT